MGFKDYDAMLAETVGGRPTFKVAGQTFRCRARLPWKKFSKLLLTLTVSTASGDESLTQTEEFFNLVLVAEDRQRFLDLVNYEGDDDNTDDENVIDPKQVGAILDDLLEYYTGKAPSNASESTATPPGAGQPSNVTSLTPREATS
jgi:hypothetical protein